MGELAAPLEVQPDKRARKQEGKIAGQILEIITSGMKTGQRWLKDKVREGEEEAK